MTRLFLHFFIFSEENKLIFFSFLNRVSISFANIVEYGNIQYMRDYITVRI